MGEVVGFRKARLSGFLPDDLGRDDVERRRERERMIDLIGFAKMGQPPIIDLPDSLA